MSLNMQHLTLDPAQDEPATRDDPAPSTAAKSLPEPKAIHVHPTAAGGENASIFFVGTATTILFVFLLCQFRTDTD